MNHNLSELELKAQLLKKITHAQQYCATVQPPPNAKGSKGEAYFPADFIVETLSATLPPLGLTFFSEATECSLITEAPPISSKSKDSTPCEQITVTVKVTVCDLETGYAMVFYQNNTEKTLTSSKSASIATSAARNKLLQQIFHFYATKSVVTERSRSEQSRNERRQNEQTQTQTQNHQTPPAVVEQSRNEPKRAIADISIPDMEIYITPPENNPQFPPIVEGQKGQIMSLLDHLTDDKAGTLQNVQKIINVCSDIPPTYILMLNGIIANRLHPEFSKMLMSAVPTTNKLPALTEAELETLLPILKQKVNGKKLNSIKTEFITELKRYNCGNAVIWNAILGAITCRVAHFQQHNN